MQAPVMDSLARDVWITWLRSSLWLFRHIRHSAWLHSNLFECLRRILPSAVLAWRHRHPWGRMSLHMLAAQPLLRRSRQLQEHYEGGWKVKS